MRRTTRVSRRPSLPRCSRNINPGRNPDNRHSAVSAATQSQLRRRCLPDAPKAAAGRPRPAEATADAVPIADFASSRPFQLSMAQRRTAPPTPAAETTAPRGGREDAVALVPMRPLGPVPRFRPSGRRWRPGQCPAAPCYAASHPTSGRTGAVCALVLSTLPFGRGWHETSRSEFPRLPCDLIGPPSPEGRRACLPSCPHSLRKGVGVRGLSCGRTRVPTKNPRPASGHLFPSAEGIGISRPRCP